MTVNHRVGGSSPSRGAILIVASSLSWYGLVSTSPLPSEVTQLLADLPLFLPAIEAALAQFAHVPTDRWFREILLCILTPQSSPHRAEEAMCVLEERGFFSRGLDEAQIALILRTPESYIRFHNVKARRLVGALAMRHEVDSLLRAGLPPSEERDTLRHMVPGLGMKEASHALRNIGRRGLTILDRHILRVMTEYGLIDAIPSSISDARYRALEQLFLSFCARIGESPDVLDLYFWARATGGVFK